MQSLMEDILKELKINYKKREGEAAFTDPRWIL